MTWFDIKYSGQTYVENLTGTDEKTLTGLGFHGYATQALATANPNSANAIQMLVASPILAGNVPVGVTNIPNPTSTAQGAAATTSALTGAAAFLQPVTTFLHNLTSANFWERVGEVVLGLILVSVGVAHLTHAVPAATKIAKTVGMAAAL